jgi:hypothetical protein
MHTQDTALLAKPSTPTNPKTDRLRETRREIRRAGSALIDVSEYLQGKDLALAVRLTELCDFLLVRLASAERQAV